MHLRLAVPEDMPAAEAIYTHAVLHGSASFDEQPPPAGYLEEKRATLMAKGYPFFVLEDAGQVMAYAYAAPYRVRSAYRFTAEHSIYIAPEIQGKGMAQLLFNGLITACQGLGLKTLIAVIGMAQDQDLETSASVRAHHKAGFELVGALPNVGYKFGRWCKTVLMVRML